MTTVNLTATSRSNSLLLHGNNKLFTLNPPIQSINFNSYLLRPTSYSRSVQITVGISHLISPTIGAAFNLSVIGDVTLLLSNGGTVVVSAPTGYTQYSLSIIGISASTATGTYYGLY